MMAKNKPDKPERKLSKTALLIHTVIFEADTRGGKFFDIALMYAIVASLAVVMLDSTKAVQEIAGNYLVLAEWFFTVIFTIEYLLRIYSVQRPFKYIFSFFGIIDLMSVLPSYLSIFFMGTQYLLTIRTLRLLRIFRIFKLARHLSEAKVLWEALKESRHKITVFLLVVCSLVIIMGTVMYQVEGPENGFTSIPRSMYWAIVTMTTVGYGDIAPKTVLGQFISSIVMILGYAIIAIPTGIVTAQLTSKKQEDIITIACKACSKEGHDPDAQYCKYCGEAL